jgi:hypothetical protein
MQNVLQFAEAADGIAEVIASKNALLVIGAGASVGSGAPTASDLVKKIALHNHYYESFQAVTGLVRGSRRH